MRETSCCLRSKLCSLNSFRGTCLQRLAWVVSGPRSKAMGERARLMRESKTDSRTSLRISLRSCKAWTCRTMRLLTSLTSLVLVNLRTISYKMTVEKPGLLPVNILVGPIKVALIKFKKSKNIENLVLWVSSKTNRSKIITRRPSRINSRTRRKTRWSLIS